MAHRDSCKEGREKEKPGGFARFFLTASIGSDSQFKRQDNFPCIPVSGLLKPQQQQASQYRSRRFGAWLKVQFNPAACCRALK